MTTNDLLKKYETITRAHDKERALFNLLKANKEHIQGLIEEDPTGFWFHKAFRQTDVTDNPHTDLAIWHLLSEAQLFWKLLEEK